MTAIDAFKRWWHSLPIPWLVGDATSQADADAQATVIGQQADLVFEATKARMPSLGPADALPHIGGDRQLEQGPEETDANFRIRLQTAWDDWARAGTALEMLVQLHWAGFTDAVIAQQNGLLYSLSAYPTAGVDPTSLLVIEDASTSVTLGVPWWTIDAVDAMANRFVVLFPTSAPAFMCSGTAVFDDTDYATVTWNNPFTDSTYVVQPGAVYGEMVTVSADLTTRTPTTCGIYASGPFTGSVDVKAWTAGANPFNDLHAGDLARVRRIIERWKPARTICVALYVITTAPVWGYPTTTTWGQVGLNWGASASTAYLIGV